MSETIGRVVSRPGWPGAVERWGRRGGGRAGGTSLPGFVRVMMGLACGAAVMAAEEAKITAALTPESGRLVVEARGVPAPVPVFFTAQAEQVVRVGVAEVAGEARLRVKVLQGKPEVLALGLAGEGEVVEVSGNGLREWAVRQGVGATAGKRFLELRPVLPVAGEMDLVVRTRRRMAGAVGMTGMGGAMEVLLVTAGEAAGFSGKVALRPEAAVDVRVMAVAGLTATGEARLEVRVVMAGLRRGLRRFSEKICS